MQFEVNDLIDIFLVRTVAVPAVIVDALGQAMTLRTQLLLGEINSGPLLFLRCRCFVIAGRRLGDGERESATASHLHNRQGRNLQSAFRAPSAAVEEVTETECLFSTFRNERGILHRDQFRVRVERRLQDSLMKVRPRKGSPELARNRALRVIAVAA